MPCVIMQGPSDFHAGHRIRPVPLLVEEHSFSEFLKSTLLTDGRNVEINHAMITEMQGQCRKGGSLSSTQIAQMWQAL